MSYRQPRKKDWIKTLIYIALYLVIIGLAAIYLLLSYWYIWIVMVGVGLVILSSWHARSSAYHCPICSYEFEISMLTDFFSPHGIYKKGAWKYLKCSNCSNRSKMQIIVKVEPKTNLHHS